MYLLFSLSIILWGFVQVVAWTHSWFLFIAGQWVGADVPWLHFCFQCLAIMDKTAINIHIQVFCVNVKS